MNIIITPISNTTLRRALIASLWFVLLCGHAQAQLLEQADAIDIKPSLMWMSGDLAVRGFDQSQYDSFLGEGEIWSKNWGLSARLLQNDDSDVFGLPENSEYLNLDLKRRFGSQDKSNFELGLGWQELNINEQLDASGPKVSLSGRFNVRKSIQVYGQTAYFPELDNHLGDDDGTAFEFEAGLLYQPIPNVSLKAGYRIFELDMESAETNELGSSSSFLLGTDFSF